MRWPLGVMDIVYAARGDMVQRARAAQADGYAHIDPPLGTDPASLALPIGCPTAFPKPVDTWCSTPAPQADIEGSWDRAVRWWRAAPHALLEPHASAVVCSAETVRAFRAAVPGVRLLVDTGHVAAIRASCSTWPTTCSCGRAGPARRNCTSTTRAASSTSRPCSRVLTRSATKAG